MQKGYAVCIRNTALAPFLVPSLSTSLFLLAVRFGFLAASKPSQTKANRKELARNWLAGSQSRHSKRAYLNSF